MLVSCVWEQRNDAGSLNCCRDLSLVLCASTCDSSREDLASLCHEVLQSVYIFVVDDDRLVGTELADLASSVHAAHVSSVFHIHYLPFLLMKHVFRNKALPRTERLHRSLRKNQAYRRQAVKSVEPEPAVEPVQPAADIRLSDSSVRPDRSVRPSR